MTSMAILKYSYLINLIFLVLHEMDAIYWKEWRVWGVVNDAFGRNFFLLVHIPLFFIVFWGMLHLSEQPGLYISIVVSAFLIVHFFLHLSALKENLFNKSISFGIISMILLFSVIQLITSIINLLSS